MPIPEQLDAGPVVLTRVRPADVDDVAAAVAASHAEISPWMDWAYPEYSRDDAITWASASWQGWLAGTAFEFVLRTADDGTVVGTIGLNQRKGHAANLGFWVHTAHTGRGLCTAATRRLARAACEDVGLSRVYLRHVVGHDASGRVATKVGFQLEGRVRNAMLHRGVLVDMMQYALIGADEILPG